ncbi:MAG TPA: EI24 domain-containing protein, partial [Allocoleopsis sp.]
AMTQKRIPQPALSIVQSPFSLIAGAIYPLRALWLLLKTPRLRKYIVMPIALNLVLGVTLYAGLLVGGMQAIDTLLASAPTWTTALSHGVSDITTQIPQPAIALPNWQIQIPTWLPHFPTWHLTAPTWLPHWSIPLPDWSLQAPNWIGELPGWGLAVLLGLLRLILIFVLLLVTGFIFLQFGVLLGSPWYGKLSEEIERLQTGQLYLVELNPVQDIGRAVAYELKKLPLTLGVGVPLLLLHFFPGVGTLLSTIGGIALASTIACMDFLDAAVERRRPRFRDKLGIVFRSFPASASFGLVCLGLASIPLVNLLSIPICVAAGTVFFCDRILPWMQQPEKH